MRPLLHIRVCHGGLFGGGASAPAPLQAPPIPPAPGTLIQTPIVAASSNATPGLFMSADERRRRNLILGGDVLGGGGTGADQGGSGSGDAGGGAGGPGGTGGGGADGGGSAP